MSNPTHSLPHHGRPRSFLVAATITVVGTMTAGIVMLLAPFWLFLDDSPHPTINDDYLSPLADHEKWPSSLTEIRLGVPPYLEPELLLPTYETLGALLSERLRVPVRLVIPSSYEQLISDTLAGRLDLIQLPPLSYVRARAQDPAILPLAAQVSEGAPTYLGYVLVRTDSDFDTIEDLARRSVCIADRLSSSGWLFLRELLRQRGHDPDAFFGRIEVGGSHTECVRQLRAGKVHAASAASVAIATLRRAQFPLHELRVIAKTDRLPYDAYCVRAGLPRPAARRIKHELLSIGHDPAAMNALAGGTLQLNGWVGVHDSDFDAVRRVARAERIIP